MTRRGYRRASLLLVWAALCGVPMHAHAFSDPAAFTAPVLEAGGGGRFYTNSPAEGYGCDSCHSGGKAPEVEITGLPERYVPRATYELRVSWSRKIAHASAAIELTDEAGRGTGTLALPAEGGYLDAEQCEPVEIGLLAAQLYAADRDRSVAAMPDCGATMLRVQWTAPAKDVGPIWLAGSVLVSDHEGNFTGDGVRNFALSMPPFGGSTGDVVTHGSCSVAPPRTDTSRGGAFAVAIALAFALRHRRVQRGLRSVTHASTKRCSS